LGASTHAAYGLKAMLTYQYTYAYGAVSPMDGKFDSLVLPLVNTECMQLFITEIGKRYTEENVVMVVDGAGWHKSKTFVLPQNLRLHFLPPYSPELNPQEHVWDELREKYFHKKPLKAWMPWSLNFSMVCVSLSSRQT
jgi:hypothetical protein